MDTDVDDKERDKIGRGPACDNCGTLTVLLSSTLDPRFTKQEIRIYRCPTCQREEVVVAPIA